MSFHIGPGRSTGDAGGWSVARSIDAGPTRLGGVDARPLANQACEGGRTARGSLTPRTAYGSVVADHRPGGALVTVDQLIAQLQQCPPEFDVQALEPRDE